MIKNIKLKKQKKILQEQQEKILSSALDILVDKKINDQENLSDDNVIIQDFAKANIAQILFKIPYVENALIGTPKDVRDELDNLAIKARKNPEDDKLFNKIHLYMHGYLISVVLKKFPFIRGFQTVDIYQETLMALRFKAIPGFKKNKGMSFLNFSKMCIRRHLITLLNTSKNRKRDQSMNTSVSLDSKARISKSGEESQNTLANIIKDTQLTADHAMAGNEVFNITKKTLLDFLSDFEKLVVLEYLEDYSYKEVAERLSKKLNKKYNTKSIDNALLRIRKKAEYLLRHSKKEDLPLLISEDEKKC